MLLRRIRGVVTSALLWGTISSLAGAVLISIMSLTYNRGDVRQTWSELLDLIPGFFGYTAMMGGLLAIVVAIAERSSSIWQLSARRLKVWGAVAGAMAGAGMASWMAMEATTPGQVSLKSLAYIVLGGTFSGAQGASIVLHFAQRSRAKVEA